MIWLALAVLAALTIAPLAWTLRRAGDARGRREAAMALHRSQLDELERDLAERRIDAAEHATAVLEVQRRLLSANATLDATPRTSSRAPLIAALVLVPLAAFALYLPGASPSMPALPLAARVAAAEKQRTDEAALVDRLREKIAGLDPKSEQARAGLVLLGNVEDERGNLPAAADAWREALNTRFDPLLAAQTAEAISRVAGQVTPEAVTLFQQALAGAAADAPWRGVVEQRIKEGQGSALDPLKGDP